MVKLALPVQIQLQERPSQPRISFFLPTTPFFVTCGTGIHRPLYYDAESGDTIYLEPGEITHCVTVSYTDEAWGRFDCEMEKYIREWKIRTQDGMETGTQMITVLDTNPPLAEFLFTPIDYLETVIDGDTLNVPVYQMSTGSNGCE